MKKILLLLAVLLTNAGAWAQTYYAPSTSRATNFEAGKKYLIYNTCMTSANDNTYAGLLYNDAATNRIKVDLNSNQKAGVTESKYLWEIIPVEGQEYYYIKSVGTGNYVTFSSSDFNTANSTSGSNMYFQPWTSTECTKAGVSSENRDGSLTANASIGSDVFTITADGKTNGGNGGQGKCFSGTASGFDNWESAQPFVVYEVQEVATAPVEDCAYYLYALTYKNGVYENRFIGASNATTATYVTTLDKDDKNYIWYCTSSADGVYQFQNGNGSYLGAPGNTASILSATPADIALEQASYNYTVKLKSGDYYYVIRTNRDQVFDRSSSSYAEGNGDFHCTDFVFVPVTVPASFIESLQLNSNKVGYPKSTSESSQAITAALNNQTDDAKLTKTLAEAISSYYEETDVNLPEDGKAYTITCVDNAGVKAYLGYVDGRVQGVKSLDNIEAINRTFVCRKTADGVYAFVLNSGKFLKNQHDGESTPTGNTATFSAGINDFVVAKFQRTGAEYTLQDYSPTAQELFGKLTLKVNNSSAHNSYMYCKPSNTGGNKYASDYASFHTDANSRLYFTNGVSNAFIIEEVTYPNTPNMNGISGTMITGEEFEGKNISTFSAPFATVIPADVDAYYVAAGDMNGSSAIVTKVDKVATPAIPANQGFILVGTPKGLNAITMVPATTEAVLQLGENANLLGHSAGEDKEYNENEHNYILTGQVLDGVLQVGFFWWNNGRLAMNKAYLKGNITSGVNAMKLVWGGETTDIEAVAPATNVNAPIYDLSGRRVKNTAKGGIYIQNGKKFIVK